MLAIKGGTVITATGSVMDPGTVIIEDGKIVEVVQGSKAPQGADVIDAEGKYVMPGMIDAHSHIGLLGEPMVWALVDVNELTDPVSPHVRSVDAFHADDVMLSEIRAGGVTAAFTGPGSGNVIGGIGFAFKMAGDRVDQVMIPGTEAMKMALGENPKRVYGTRTMPQLPQTRLGNAAVLREALAKAIEYGKKRADKDTKDKTDLNMKWEALQPVIKREMKARIHSHRADDIMTAIRISEEFGLDCVIEHATEGYKIADVLADKGIACTVGPLFMQKSKMELQDINPANPGILARRGVKVAIQVDGASATKWLPICAGIALREGMPEEEAFKAITLHPAEILGIDDRVGSLEPGKDADIAIFDGHPLQTLSRCVKTIINGNVAHSLS